MSGDDYRSESTWQTPEQATRVARELEAARARAVAEAELEQQRQAEIRRQLQVLREQRPLGERLTEMRCATCHNLAVIEAAAPRRLGWRWTVERMRWWHGARVSREEAATIASHLDATRGDGVPPFAGWLSGGLVLLAGGAWVWSRLWKSRWTRVRQGRS
jgi:hypothetical protein